eukprot:jgi/Botrbrau1/8013/Bobra.384_2s0035.1
MKGYVSTSRDPGGLGHQLIDMVSLVQFWTQLRVSLEERLRFSAGVLWFAFRAIISSRLMDTKITKDSTSRLYACLYCRKPTSQPNEIAVANCSWHPHPYYQWRNACCARYRIRRAVIVGHASL